jgi:hypothetical protein
MNAENVIDSKTIDHALREKPVPAFSHRALVDETRENLACCSKTYLHLKYYDVRSLACRAEIDHANISPLERGVSTAGSCFVDRFYMAAGSNRPLRSTGRLNRANNRRSIPKPRLLPIKFDPFRERNHKVAYFLASREILITHYSR